mgnify:CR=1 FL=1
MLHQQSPVLTSLPTTFASELRGVGVNVLTERLSSTGKYHEIIISDTLEARKVFMRTVKKTIAANAATEEYDTEAKKTYHCKRHLVKIGDDLKEFFGTRVVLIPFASPV